jgi:hypothetical protein
MRVVGVNPCSWTTRAQKLSHLLDQLVFELAVDRNGGTIWTSGTFAPAWIDTLLPGQFTVDSILLNAVMWPNPGYANHVIYGRPIEGGYIWLGEINTYVQDYDWFQFASAAPNVPFTAITVYTPSEATSWVGWRDIYVYGTPYVPPPPPPPAEEQPANAGDVVGHDLASGEDVGASYLGNLGFWDGENVVQVMNETTVVQTVPYSNFRNKAKPWGAVHTNIVDFTVTSCFSTPCNFLDPAYYIDPDRETLNTRVAMVRRARQIQQIGADYTITTVTNSADPQMYDRFFKRYYPAQRGLYRCDSFVVDLFAFTTVPRDEYWMPSYLGAGTNLRIEGKIRNTPLSWLSTWNAKVQGLFVGNYFPAALYEKFKAF